MVLRRWEPFRGLREAMDSLFEDSFVRSPRPWMFLREEEETLSLVIKRPFPD